MIFRILRFFDDRDFSNFWDCWDFLDFFLIFGVFKFFGFSSIDLIDKDNDGWTAFMFTCKYGRQDVVKFSKFK